MPQRFPLPVAPLFGCIYLRVELAGASQTCAVAEGGFRVLGDVVFDLLPVPLVIPNLFAGGANGHKPAQLAYLVNGSLESIDQLVATLLQLHLFGDRSQGPQRQEGAILVVDLHQYLVLEPDDPPASQTFGLIRTRFQ